MSAYAVIQTGGKQYKVSEGDVLEIERVGEDEGNAVVFDEVLALGGDSGFNVGAPFVDGAKVSGEVLSNHRGQKLIIYKKKRRKGYERKMGHRQNLTKVKITSIAG